MGSSNFSIYTSFKAKDGISPTIETMTKKAGLFDRIFSKLNPTQNKFGSCFKATMNKANFLMTTFIGNFVFTKVKDFYDKSVQAAETQLTAEQKLTQVLKNNANIRTKGQDAYLSVTQSLFKMASEMQKKGVLGDEVLIGGMATLGSMGFDDTTIKTIMPSIADLVVSQKGYNATIEDVENISKGLGRAIAGQAGALSKMGIILDKNQKKQFANMTTMQRTSMIAELLKNRVGGLNEDFAKTNQGVKINFMNNFSDALETMGKKLMPLQAVIFKNLNKFLPIIVPVFDKIFNTLQYGFKALKPVFAEFNGLIKYLSQTLIPWLVEKSPAIKFIFENVFVPGCVLAIKALESLFKIINFIYGAGSNLFNFVKDNWLPLLLTMPAAILGVKMAFDILRVQMALMKMEGGLMAVVMNSKVVTALNGLTGAIWKNVASLWAQAAAFAATPLGMITIGITALVGVIWLLWKNWDKVREGAKKFADFMTGSTFGKILSCIFPVFGISAMLIKNWDKIKEVIVSAVIRSIEALKSFGTCVKNVFINAYEHVKPFFDLIFNLINPFGFILKNAPKIVDTIKGIKNGDIKFGSSRENNNSFFMPEPKLNGNKRDGNINVGVTLTNKTDFNASVTTSLISSNNLQLNPG